jgi:hypothetical protein
MEVILFGGPHDHERRGVEARTWALVFDKKAVYVNSGEKDSGGRVIFVYDETASKERQGNS